jgi:hypothetical protein
MKGHTALIEPMIRAGAYINRVARVAAHVPVPERCL